MAFWSRRPRWGTILLGAWLILWGLTRLSPDVGFRGSAEVLGVLAIMAGVMILLER